jgi:hypothetical protein
MTTIVTRAGKGSALTHNELDTNFTNLNTDKVEASGDSMTGDLSFGDNNKAVFGASDDLQIYHDGSNSYIDEVGTGTLRIRGHNQVRLTDTSDNIAAIFKGDAESTLYHNNSAKLTTTSTGIDVTGTVTADGLTVDGQIQTNIATTGRSTLAVLSNTAALAVNNQATIQLKNGGQSAFISGESVQANAGMDIVLSSNNGVGTETVKARFAENGDISFYEDTGTTAKFFWDASAEQLKLGTIEGAAGGSLVTKTDSNGYALAIEENSGTERWSLGVNVDGDLGFFNSTDTTASLTLDDSGNVGIGTTSPATNLHINQSGSVTGDYGVRVGQSSFTGNYGSFTLDSTNIQVKLASSHTYPLGFWVAGSERARIDSSGNLLVGQSTTAIPGAGNTTTGISISGQYDAIYASRDSGQPVTLNRNTSDGDIIQLRKDGTTVGSIGNLGTRMYIDGSGVSGINFSSGALVPRNNGSASDAVINIGGASTRFKDLYLSGGVYLGGTGAANKLDDYEEGTWTPTPTSGTLNAGATGSYVKIGSLVHVQGQLSFSANGTTSRIDGLPFRPRIEATLNSIRQRFLVYSNSNTAIYGFCQDVNNALHLQNENRSTHNFDTADGVYTFAFTYEV